MRTTVILLAALSIAGAGPQAFASDDVPVPVNVVPTQPVDVVVEKTPPSPITFSQRLAWFDNKTFGVSNLIGSLPGATLDTIIDHPHEAGPHWQGFGERYGVSVSTNALSNSMEASLGAIWGEDPRYFRAGPTVPLKSRIGHIAKMTFMAADREGNMRPAYARYIAYSGSAFISDAWREPSDTSTGNELGRIPLAFLGRMAGNAFDEFWPDARRKLFHHATKD